MKVKKLDKKDRLGSIKILSIAERHDDVYLDMVGVYR